MRACCLNAAAKSTVDLDSPQLRKVLVNGELLGLLSVQDRALNYGDGLFETIRIQRGKPTLYSQHLTRLDTSCKRLSIPFSRSLIEADVEELLLANTVQQAVLKILISRGRGGRGYTPAQKCLSMRILTLHDLPAYRKENTRIGVAVLRCKHPLSRNSATAGMKHLNRLDQVLASMECAKLKFDSCKNNPISEGIMCDESGNIIAGTKSNLFFVKNGQLFTADLRYSGVEGVMRSHLISQFSRQGIEAKVIEIDLQELQVADELFLCNSVFGVWPVVKMHDDDKIFHWSIGGFTRQAQVIAENALNL